MPKTTPPKGRPTPGRRDRSVAAQRAASRRRIIRFSWGVVAVVVLIAILVLGTGTGGDVDNLRGTSANVVLPTLVPAAWLLRRPGASGWFRGARW